MDLAQWPQEIVVKQMEEIVPKNPINNNTTSGGKPSSTSATNCGAIERKIRPQKDEPVNCPRCNSTNTKFCYYNNYSLSQPRYFCKTCRRYWTEGGSLRNIPVGGGSRKNRLIRSSSSSSSIDHHHQVVVMNNSKKMNLPQQQQQLPSAAAAAADLMLSSRLPLPLLHPNPNKPTIQQDLNLSFSSHLHHHHHHHHHHQDLKTIAELIQVPNYESNNNVDKEENNNNNNPAAGQLSAMEMLSVGMSATSSPSSTRGGMMMMSSFLPMPIPDPNNHTSSSSSVYSSSPFSLPEYKPTLNFSFSLDGMNGNNDDGGYNGHHHHHHHSHLLQGMQETSTSGRLFFPFEDLKSGTNGAGDHNNNGTADQDRDHHPAAGFCWNGVLGAGGASW